MSSPQQPWSQPGPGGPPPGYGPPPQGNHQPPQGYGSSQPGYGQPAAPQPYGGPTGQLVLNLQKPFGAMGMISPVVKIDGYPAQCSWGTNSFPVPAGRHQIELAQSYLWTYGSAVTQVDVTPGQPTELWYAGPMWTFGMGGAVGTEPQKRPGQGLFIGLMVFVGIVLLIVLLAVVIGIASSGS